MADAGATAGETAEETKRKAGRPRIELPAFDFGDNSLSDVIAAVEAGFADLAKANTKREQVNKSVQSIRDSLFAKGIPKEAFDLCVKYIDWPDDKKRNFDVAFAICRKAAGAPIQKELFDTLEA